MPTNYIPRKTHKSTVLEHGKYLGSALRKAAKGRAWAAARGHLSCVRAVAGLQKSRQPSASLPDASVPSSPMGCSNITPDQLLPPSPALLTLKEGSNEGPVEQRTEASNYGQWGTESPINNQAGKPSTHMELSPYTTLQGSTSLHLAIELRFWWETEG